MAEEEEEDDVLMQSNQACKGQRAARAAPVTGPPALISAHFLYAQDGELFADKLVL